MDAPMAVHESATLTTPFGRAVYYDLDSPLRMHAHSALHVLVHLGGAPARYTFADGDEAVSHRSRATLIDPWVAHRDARGDRSRSQVVALYIEPTMVRTRPGAIGQTGFLARSVKLTDVQIALIDRIVPLVRGHGAPENDTETFARLIESILSAFGAFERAGTFPGTGAMDRHVRASLQFLNERKGQPFDGEAFVAASELKRSRLFERFHDVVGLTPKQYADALRAEVAIGLLAVPERTIASIAKELDFPAPAHLSRFLRDYTGLTPSEHRRRASARGEASIYINEFE